MDSRLHGFFLGIASVVSLVPASSPAGDPLACGAEVYSLVGPTAEILLGLNPARPVLILESNGLPVALLLAAHEDQIESIRSALVVDANPPYCDLDRPVGCCDPARNTMVLPTELGWLDYGEA